MGRNVRGLGVIFVLSLVCVGPAGCRDALALERGVNRERASTPPGFANAQVRDAGALAATTGDGGTPATPALHAADIVLRGNHACARMDDGTVRCWGSSGGISLGWSPSDDSTRPRLAAGLTGVTQLALGTAHNCALMIDRSIQCWGQNEHGELGLGSTSLTQYRPARVRGVEGATEVEVGESHACARLENGTVRCWGQGRGGQLGLSGVVRQVPTPTSVAGLTDVAQLSLGPTRTCARLANGSVSCWGDRLAESQGGAQSTPTGVHDLTEVAQVALGTSHVCVRMVNGSVRCWGRNHEGQLGDGTRIDRGAPVRVVGLLNVAEIAVGARHTCARSVRGNVYCWGSNHDGQIGDGTTVDRLLPAAVSGLSNVAQIAASDAFSCARWNNGAVRCWGQNHMGQLGDGTRIGHPSPSVVAW